MLRPDILQLFNIMTNNRDSPTSSKDTPPLTPEGEHEGDNILLDIV